MSHAFGAFIEHESEDSRPMTGPAKVVYKDTITPVYHELDYLQWGHQLNGPYSEPTTPNVTYPSTPRELEQSSPPTPKRDQAVDALVQSASNPSRNKWRLFAAGIMFTMMGLSDAATGAVLPYMEIDYHIGYALVSMIFVANAAGKRFDWNHVKVAKALPGFILAAPFVQAIDRKLGRSRSYIVVNILTTIGYTLLVCALPFGVVVFAFLLLGFALGLFLAMTNLFVVNLLNGTVILGAMHALYGFGGVISPIVATTMITHGAKWSYFYTIPLAFSVISLAFMGWAFKGFEEDGAVQLMTALERTASRQTATLGEPTNFDLLKRALRKRATLLGALFILFYQGAEVAISGWVISFLINYRQGDPSKVGNVTSGFWGGITLGRLVLTPLAPKIGEKLAVTIFIVIAAALQLMVWLVPNIVGIAVAESLVGLVLGPVYPCATAILSRLLPRNIQIPAISFVTSMGSSGGALIPLVTGLMAQKLGTVVLHPIVLVSCAIMLAAWSFLPKVSKRAE